MRRLVTNIISVVYSLLRFSLIKLFKWKFFDFSFIERFSPNVILEIEKGGMIHLGKKVRAHSGCVFKARKNAEIYIEDNVSFNYGCMVFCKEKVIIGEGTEFGPNVMIYDHDHNFRCEGGIKQGLFNTAPVIIGKNVWIGCNTVILKGSVIEDGAVIAAGSIVKGTVPQNCVYIQKRETTNVVINL